MKEIVYSCSRNPNGGPTHGLNGGKHTHRALRSTLLHLICPCGAVLQPVDTFVSVVWPKGSACELPILSDLDHPDFSKDAKFLAEAEESLPPLD